MNDKRIKKLERKIAKQEKILDFICNRPPHTIDIDVSVSTFLLTALGALGIGLFTIFTAVFNPMFFIGIIISALSLTAGILDMNEVWSNLAYKIIVPKIEKNQKELEDLKNSLVILEENKNNVTKTLSQDNIKNKNENEEVILIKVKNKETSNLIKQILAKENITVIEKEINEDKENYNSNELSI